MPDRSLQTKELQEILNHLSPVLSSIRESVFVASSTFFDFVCHELIPLIESAQCIPRELKPIFRSMASCGWFVSGQMGRHEIQELRGLVDAERKEEMDLYMSRWIEKRIPRIRKRSYLLYGNRFKVLEVAFLAHASGQFGLSVPVLLIQLEAICFNLFKEKQFSEMNSDTESQGEKEVPVHTAFSEVIFQTQQFSHDSGGPADRIFASGHHEVMQGIAFDHVSHLNSQKLISLLDFILSLADPCLKSDGLSDEYVG